MIWKDLSNNIGANGVVEIHRPGEYLQLHYYDDVHPKPGAALGDYYEKYSVARDNGEYVFSVDIGKLSKKHIPSHETMWDKALEIIKQHAEKGEW